MSKKTLFLIVLFIAVPLGIYFFLPTDEAKIRTLFKESARAVEKEDLEAVMKAVSLTYRDDHGMTYLYVKEVFRRLFQQFDGIEVRYGRMHIDVREKTARAEIEIRVIALFGPEKGYLAGSMTEPLHPTFTLGKERMSWKVTGTEGLSAIQF